MTTETDKPKSERVPVIELVDLRKTYRVGTELVHALRGTSLVICENEYVAIMGASGSGKSTMLNILGCLDVPTGGVYRLRGQDVSRLSQSKLARIRGQTDRLRLPVLRVARPHNGAQERRAAAALHPGAQPAPTRHRRPPARKPPPIAPTTAPTSSPADRSSASPWPAPWPSSPRSSSPTNPPENLDSKTGDEIMEVFDSLWDDGQTIVIVTHEDHIARRCKRTIKLSDGQIVSDSGNGQFTPTVQEAAS